MRRILFCNIGWANNYNGDLNDRPVGDATYIKGGGLGHEIANFALSNGYYYGYVETKSRNGQAQKIRIENIDSIAADRDRLDNVLVIWCATNQENGGKYIVGWYRHAMVFRNRMAAAPGSKRAELYLDKKIATDDYMISCAEGDAFLVKPEKRIFKVPTARQDGYGFGQSYLWYPTKNETPEVREYIDSVLEYIQKEDKKD